MTRSIKFSINEFYHIYNRGTDKRKTFLSEENYKRFSILLYLCNSTEPLHIDMRRESYSKMLDNDRGKKLVDIGAYCLMPNHFHLLLHECIEGGISLFM